MEPTRTDECAAGLAYISPFVTAWDCAYIQRVNWLTRQEQLVLCSVLSLLLVGLAVKIYRAGHARSPAVAASAVAQTNESAGAR